MQWNLILPVSVKSRLGCLRLLVMANSPLNSMGIYTAYDRAPLPRIGECLNVLHTDLKFENQAIQCCLFEPREVKYGKGVGRKSCIRLHDYALLMKFARILAQDIGELVGSSLE